MYHLFSPPTKHREHLASRTINDHQSTVKMLFIHETRRRPEILSARTLACVADDSFPFYQAGRSSKRASKRARLGCAKIGQKWGRGEPHPLPLLLIFSHSLALARSFAAFGNERLLRRLNAKLLQRPLVQEHVESWRMHISKNR